LEHNFFFAYKSSIIILKKLKAEKKRGYLGTDRFKEMSSSASSFKLTFMKYRFREKLEQSL